MRGYYERYNKFWEELRFDATGSTQKTTHPTVRGGVFSAVRPEGTLTRCILAFRNSEETYRHTDSKVVPQASCSLIMKVS
jgi:hypothetical protein